MRVRWKLVGLAGLAGVAATGVVLARKYRAHRDYQPDELRERLHRGLAEVAPEQAGAERPPASSATTEWIEGPAPTEDSSVPPEVAGAPPAATPRPQAQ